MRRRSRVLFAVITLAVMVFPIGALAQDGSLTGTARKLSECGRFWPAERTLDPDVIENPENKPEGWYEYRATLTFDLTGAELNVMECVGASHLQVDFIIDGFSEDVWSNNETQCCDDTFQFYDTSVSEGNRFVGSLKGYSLNNSRISREQDAYVSIYSPYWVDPSTVSISYEWVPSIWQIADDSSDCYVEHVQNGDEICMIEVDRAYLNDGRNMTFDSENLSF